MESLESRLKDALCGITDVDHLVRKEAEEHTSRLVMPPRAMGRLHQVWERLCAISGNLQPVLQDRAVLVFAGDHGVVREGVSAFPQEVSLEMIRCFLRGGAGINAISRQVGASVHVLDMGTASRLEGSWSEEESRALQFCRVAAGTKNLARGPAMSREQAVQSIRQGFEAASKQIEDGARLLATGDMGIGNTTPSSAIGCVLTGRSVEEMVGRGTLVGDEGMRRKSQAISAGLAVNKPDAGDGLDVLAKVGGFEIGGIAGEILAAARHKVPVVLDGLISTAGALIAASLAPLSRNYMFAGHVSEEPGHRFMLQTLDLEPLLDLGMRLGEGTGAAQAMHILDSAVALSREVMTFEQAGVSCG